MLWDGTISGWNQGKYLEQAVARAGLDLQDMEAAIAHDPLTRDRMIEAHEAELQAAGHWGVPTFVFNGEPFFGQDRVEILVWRLKQHGLRLREN